MLQHTGTAQTPQDDLIHRLSCGRRVFGHPRPSRNMHTRQNCDRKDNNHTRLLVIIDKLSL
jgi:hypothetical protein